jgi:hypothetical protein
VICDGERRLPADAVERGGVAAWDGIVVGSRPFVPIVQAATISFQRTRFASHDRDDFRTWFRVEVVWRVA